MPKTKSPPTVVADEFDLDGLKDLLITRKREFSIGAIVVVAIAGGVMLWRMSVNQKNQRAQTALVDAGFTIYSGNKVLGESQLQTAADRYRDTRPGVQAAMLLAQTDFEQARWDDGIKALDAVEKSSEIDAFKPAVEALMGGGYADMKKYDDAAKHYQNAVDAAKYQPIKDLYLADAARVLEKAGKNDDAKKIWQEIESRPDSPMIAEAKVRLGELDATPAAKN